MLKKEKDIKVKAPKPSIKKETKDSLILKECC